MKLALFLAALALPTAAQAAPVRAKFVIQVSETICPIATRAAARGDTTPEQSVKSTEEIADKFGLTSDEKTLMWSYCSGYAQGLEDGLKDKN